MNKQQVYEFLNSNNIWYEVTEHKPAYNMADMAEIEFPYPDGDAKNIFVRDDKKANYYLISVKANKRVDLKNFKNKYNTRHLSFAHDDELMNILGLIPGSVTPLGVLNDKDKIVKVYIDKEFMINNIIGVHPNENTATVWLKTSDLLNIVKEHGNSIELIDIQ